MNRKLLENFLIKNGIPKSEYNLYGGMYIEGLCMDYVYGNWEIYVSERGIKSIQKTFKTESEACYYFLNEIAEIYCGLGLQMPERIIRYFRHSGNFEFIW